MTQNRIIHRYDEYRSVSTFGNPLEDILVWLTGLNSKGFVTDILSERHHFSSARETAKASQLISIFATNAIGLIEQGFSGPIELSFLPLYYAIFNLSKIYIVLSGHMGYLLQNRYHGVRYPPNGRIDRDFLEEAVILKERGILPLLYISITGEDWRWEEREMKLGSIYPFIFDVSYEFESAFNRPALVPQISVNIEGNENDGRFRIVAELTDTENLPTTNTRRCLRVLRKSFPQTEPDSPYVLRSNYFESHSIEDALLTSSSLLRRYLLTDRIGTNQFGGTTIQTRTPFTGSHLLLPEELPIWISFFHLSCIVRYKPDYLNNLEDTAAWPLILTLRKHAIYRFLLIFWSFFYQECFLITAI